MNEDKLMRRRAWIVMLVAFFAGIALAWAQNKVPPVINEVQESLSISMTAAGWLSSIFCVTGIVMALPAAAFVNKLGLKKSGAIALLVTIIGNVIGLIAPNTGILMFSRLLEGLGVGLISVLAPTIISMWFAPAKRGLPMGIWGSWQMVAQAFTFLLAGGLTVSMGWKGMWWFGLILLAVATVLYVWKVVSPPPAYNHADVEEAGVNIFEAFKHRSVWMICIVAFLFCVACFGWVTWVATYWSSQLGLDINFANSIVGYIYMFEILVVVVEGWILDRIKSRKTFGVVMSLLYGLLLFVAFRFPSTAWILPFAIIYPILEGAICTTFWTIAPQTTPKPALASAALAVMVMGMNLGMVVGPPLIGYVVENIGWQVATIPMAVTGLLCGLFFALTQLYNDKGEKIKG